MSRAQSDKPLHASVLSGACSRQWWWWWRRAWPPRPWRRSWSSSPGCGSRGRRQVGRGGGEWALDGGEGSLTWMRSTFFHCSVYSTKEKILLAEVSPASSLKQNKSHHTAWRRISKCSFFCIKSSPVVLARREKNTCASSLGKGFERGLINCAVAIVRLMAHRCTQIWIRLASMSPFLLKNCLSSHFN